MLSVTGSRVAGCYSNVPTVYDRLQTSNGTSILSLKANNRWRGQRTGQATLVFAGPNAIANNGGAATPARTGNVGLRVPATNICVKIHSPPLQPDS